MDRELEIEHRLTKVEEAVSLLPDLKNAVDELNGKLSKYEGRWGAIVLIGTGLWAVFAVFKDDFFKLFKGH